MKLIPAVQSKLVPRFPQSIHINDRSQTVLIKADIAVIVILQYDDVQFSPEGKSPP
tara:strand:+ start:1306 stop:1473 length:168 start_codon:yes stop_codon:yes gene_type:complete